MTTGLLRNPAPGTPDPTAPRPPGRDPARPDRPPGATVPTLRLLRYEPDPDDPDAPDPPPPARRAPSPAPVAPADHAADAAALRRHALTVVRLALEVLDDRRPLVQLAGHLHPSVLTCVRVARAQQPARRPARMTSLHLSRPRAGAAEVVAVYRRGGRSGALAARFEGPTRGGRVHDPGRWRCVVFRML